MSIVIGPALAVALVTAVLVAAVVARLTRLETSSATVTAAVRAIVQLGAVSLLIGAIVGSVPLSAAFVALMVVVAARTAGRRMTPDRSGWWAIVPIALAPVPVVAALVLAGVVPPQGIAVIPMAGILIGGTMTATALAGRRALDELEARRGEVEAALSLGMLPRDAALEIARCTAGQSLVPVTDQTRTVGLVTLPGAFVGMLLGGASPVQAGAVQLLVLILLLAVETIAVAVAVELVCRGLVHRTTEPQQLLESHRGPRAAARALGVGR
ncbi:ABC transporter permease [Pseudonocardia sp. KRD-184]|uniref:ABC transporter permease n=1 Tax=Pseudonocardia oceani TaxID=2792013 RepID=A0ABS6UCK3_9PSEU|nr:ABC transporter permease [Pseudonocardia oceani]MBW0092151.1 ABC transporter permease [Pseudonocardia oceani]MBW0097274.1 ABC transporter permease [Pseudonocardia oceani]MBW0107900.1 ABC transporter permease [Pseudonocardia oceani]MBW0121274.1 ABC transporter permease [Pseudonocardia oceani]MBW0129967.1 ABC transporter permease [Pseudonocardia oceani]